MINRIGTDIITDVRVWKKNLSPKLENNSVNGKALG
jgi:hypothetical protein